MPPSCHDIDKIYGLDARGCNLHWQAGRLPHSPLTLFRGNAGVAGKGL